MARVTSILPSTSLTLATYLPATAASSTSRALIASVIAVAEAAEASSITLYRPVAPSPSLAGAPIAALLAATSATRTLPPSPSLTSLNHSITSFTLLITSSVSASSPPISASIALTRLSIAVSAASRAVLAAAIAATTVAGSSVPPRPEITDLIASMSAVGTLYALPSATIRPSAKKYIFLLLAV
ncbi:MAG: hypothetical protein J6D03_00655 [Clostridia bacterium]|nr:hypothetical protein [Clostridia bacterium]